MPVIDHERAGRPRTPARCVALVVGVLAGVAMVVAAPAGPAAAGPAEEAFVRALYADFYDAEPTSEQLTHFTDELTSGRSHLSVAEELALGITNLTGHPALALMTGLSKSGMPLSMQLVGRMHEEAVLFRAAAAFERATPWHTRRPPSFNQ